MHNGYFKNLPDIVHYYNTRFAKTFCEDLDSPIIEATAAEAIANGCWPVPEFPGTAVKFIGNMGLTEAEEAALIAFLETLSDERTPSAPSTVK
jgi:cytochrome c peroxidase